jgi:hypothetical protein
MDKSSLGQTGMWAVGAAKGKFMFAGGTVKQRIGTETFTDEVIIGPTAPEGLILCLKPPRTPV